MGRNTDRTGVEVADPHHDAPRHHEWGRRKTVLFGPEQRTDDDVAPGLELPVHLDHDPVAQAIGQEGLLGFGQTDLPRNPRMLERGRWRGTGPPVVARDEHHVGVCLGDAGGHGADTDFGDQLHVDAGQRVGRFGSWMSWAMSSIE